MPTSDCEEDHLCDLPQSVVHLTGKEPVVLWLNVDNLQTTIGLYHILIIQLKTCNREKYQIKLRIENQI